MSSLRLNPSSKKNYRVSMEHYWGESQRYRKRPRPSDEDGSKTDPIEISEVEDEPSSKRTRREDAIFCSSARVFSRENHVYFYAGTEPMASIQFQKEMSKVADEIVAKTREARKYGGELEKPPLILHINSPGGGIFTALSMVDFMRDIRYEKGIEIHTIVEGRAASAATFLSIQGDKRFIKKHAFMLVHELSSMAWGKYSDLKDEITNLDVLMKTIKDMYKKDTKIPARKMSKMLKHDFYWTADICLQYGLVDQIL